VRERDDQETSPAGDPAGELGDASDDWYRTVVEALHEGILVRTRDHRVIACNAAASRILGQPEEAIVGAQTAWPELRMLREDGSPFPPEELPSKVTLLTGRPCHDVVVGLQQASGETQWLSFSAHPLVRPGETEPFAAVVSFGDVTERHDTARALAEAEARFRTLVEHMPAVVHISALDETASTIYMSPQAEGLLGYAPEEWLADPELWVKVLHPDDREETLGLNLQHLTGRPMSMEYRMIARDGRVVWVREDVVVIRDPQGKPAFSQGVWLDITEKKRREEEVRRLNVALEARVAERTQQLQTAAGDLLVAKEEAERANLAKSEFLSRMSHELRTPLNAVLGFAQLLQLEGLSPEHHDSVEQIIKGGQHLLGLINEVLDIGRIETGGLALSVESVVVREVIESAADLVRPMASDRCVSVVVDGEGNATVMTDRERLQQVLLNLLSNAVKYNRDSGTVTVSWEMAVDGRVSIDVTDTGIGIAPEQMGRLFTPFERLGAELTGVEGTGLGLILVRRLVEALGGTVSVRSEQGVGSTFRVELAWAGPAAVVPAPIPAAFAGADRRASGRSGVERTPTVLYIEDDLANLALVERILGSRPDVQLVVAMQGRMGLDLARDHHPNLILLDVNLPDLSGLEVLERLREDDRTAGIPVLVISADASSSQRRLMLEAGAHDYLTKPLDVRRLVGLLEDVLGSRLAPADEAV